VIAALHLLVTLAMCTWAVRPLAGARWVWRAPRTGILLWQMLALTWVLSAVGLALAIGLAPYDAPIPAALLHWGSDLVRGDPGPGSSLPHLAAVAFGLLLALGFLAAVASSWVAVLRLRRRHRDVLALVAREDSAVPGALILDHPHAVAYCLPGTPSVVVLSSGALKSLSRDQVLAVLAHEQTHARERHDLVLLPFSALRRIAPGVRLVDSALQAVALLVEMRADEGACLHQSAESLASALRRFSTSALRPPSGALGVADSATTARLARMAGTPPLPSPARWASLVFGLVMVSTPVSFMVF
jgi:Zn-dependent protease with chaperone function